MIGNRLLRERLALLLLGQIINEDIISFILLFLINLLFSFCTAGLLTHLSFIVFSSFTLDFVPVLVEAK